MVDNKISEETKIETKEEAKRTELVLKIACAVFRELSNSGIKVCSTTRDDVKKAIDKAIDFYLSD